MAQNQKDPVANSDYDMSNGQPLTHSISAKRSHTETEETPAEDKTALALASQNDLDAPSLKKLKTNEGEKPSQLMQTYQQSIDNTIQNSVDKDNASSPADATITKPPYTRPQPVWCMAEMSY